ncbi:hypothetical protein [Mycoplasma bradburyae]|uniref:hypothetical protein n=1 Tax=Mycoplasma bradburyae TaxID=2963128 RepID=UPI0020CBE3FA|nr:hypothetical protein [Mycoplasma bradburyae]UTS70929.1 hypothetical protein NMG77_00375 [Mycoplasma bradburyae]
MNNSIFLTPSYFDGNQYLATFVNLLIYVAFLLTVPTILIFGLTFLKPKLSQNQQLNLYAFSSALLISIGMLGLLFEATESANVYVEQSLIHYETVYKNLIKIGMLVGGAVIGLTVVISFRFLYIHFTKQDHCNHSHNHSLHITNEHEDYQHKMKEHKPNIKAAWLVIILLLSHRTIDGFVLGGTVSLLTLDPSQINIGFIVSFNIHILIEVIIIHYRQIQFGEKKFRAALHNFYTTILIIPIMLIGAYVNPLLRQVGWILPIVNASGGVIITFMAIIELVPEFIHNKSMKTADWYKVLISFALGLVIAILILSFHEHTHETTSSYLSNQTKAVLSDPLLFNKLKQRFILSY